MQIIIQVRRLVIFQAVDSLSSAQYYVIRDILKTFSNPFNCVAIWDAERVNMDGLYSVPVPNPGRSGVKPGEPRRQESNALPHRVTQGSYRPLHL